MTTPLTLARADALVLCVQRTICTRCGGRTTSPAGLFVRTRHPRYPRRTVYKHARDIPTRAWLYECERKIISTNVPACEQCFPAHDENQLPLFPDLFGPHFIALPENHFQSELDRLTREREQELTHVNAANAARKGARKGARTANPAAPDARTAPVFRLSDF